jgi:hypothetical protein
MKETLKADLWKIANPAVCVVLGAVLASVLASVIHIERDNSGRGADDEWMKKQLGEFRSELNEVRRETAEMKTQNETNRQIQSQSLAETASLRAKLDDSIGRLIELTAHQKLTEGGASKTSIERNATLSAKPKEASLVASTHRQLRKTRNKTSSAREIARLRREIARLRRENAKLRARLVTTIPVGLRGA